MTTQTVFAREVVSGGLSALPPVNARLSVSPLSGAEGPAYGQVVEVPTRVEDLHLRLGDRRPALAELVIAQPVFAGNLQGEFTGAPYLLRWLTERGMHEVTGRYLGRRRVGPALIGWRLGISGPVTRIQRRAHARVAIATPVEVVPVVPAGAVAHACSGVTVNVSEGGVLAGLIGPEPDAVPAVGADVLVRFAVAGEAFALPGRVVRRQAVPRPGQEPGVAVAVAFDSPDEHGDRLRPLLFAHQLNARRVGVV